MKFTALLSLCLGFFMVILDSTIVNVALPSLASGLNSNISWLQWIVDGYTLSFASLLLLAGHMADQLGAKKLFQISVLVFITTSFLCGIASSAAMLTLFRILQGAAAAFIMPTSLSLINSSHIDNASRAKAFGIWGAVGGVAAATGPILGAVLTNTFGWRAIFLVNIPVGIICLLLTIKYLTEVPTQKSKGYDLWGQCLAFLTIATLAFILIQIGQTGWRSTFIIVCFAIFLLCLVCFLLVENKVKAPMLPLQFFKHKAFMIAVVVAVLMNIGFYGELFILPLYFHHIKHYTILMTGFALFPLMAAVGISSYISGKIIAKSHPNWAIIFGLGCSSIGYLCLYTYINQTTPYFIFIVPFLMMGSGIAFAMPAATITIMRSVAKENAGIASGTFNMSRQVGSLIGVAIFGTIIATSHSFIGGVQITLLIAAIVFLLGSLFTITLSKNS